MSLPAALMGFSAFLLLLLRMRAVAGILVALVTAQVLATLLFGGAAAAGAGDLPPHTFAGPQSGPISADAAIVLFLVGMTGFEVIAMAGEDAVRPRHALPWAIVACVLTVLILYLAVAVAALAATPVPVSGPPAPDGPRLVAALVGDKLGAFLLALSSQAGFPAMLLALSYAQVRLYLAMSRRRSLPSWFAGVSDTGAPIRLTLLCGGITALLAALRPPATLLQLAGAILPLVFAIVALSMVVTRWRAGSEEPETETGFETPLAGLVAGISIVGCGYVFFHLSSEVYLQVAGWLFAAVLASLIAYFRGELPSGLDPAEEIGKTTAKEWLDQL